MGIRILVAGGNRANVRLIKSLFADEEHEIIPVNGVALALFLSNKNYPELIISDLKMIDGTGLDLLKALREDPELRAIPFVLMTEDKPEPEFITQAIALGTRKFITLPLSKTELLCELEPYLQARQGQRPEETTE